MLKQVVSATFAVRKAAEPATLDRQLLDVEIAFGRAYETEFPRICGYIRYRVGDRDTAET